MWVRTENFENNRMGIKKKRKKIFLLLKSYHLKINFYLGKPNVGKSSLVNSLLKEKRVIVDDMPGTTRDAISVSWQYKGKRINLIDTAGIEKSLKFKVLHEIFFFFNFVLKKKDVDKKIHRSTLNAIKYSHVILCTIDSINAFRVQDLVNTKFK